MNVFRNAAAQFVYTRTYSRWLEDEGRRETWDETVTRYLEFVDAKSKGKIPKTVREELEAHIRSMSVMPSMRALWAAGPALERNNITGYNCSFLPIKDLFSFSELLFILMCGTGVGFSVESKYVSQLPAVKQQTGSHLGVFKIEDSKEGWADALKFGLECWFNGNDCDFDFSALRPRGARLLTSGGRSSGPDPLRNLLVFVRGVLLGDGSRTTGSQGRQITSLECHDICCQIAEVVVVGGVRRSSLISLSDLNDDLLRTAKNQPFPLIRAMANNSVVFNEKPNSIGFLKEWYNLAQSGTGERGIFCRFNARKQNSEYRNPEQIQGLNPCQPDYILFLTKNGLIPLREVEIGDLVWTGQRWSKLTKKWSTGIKPVYRYQTSNGYYIDCTENHRVVENGNKIEVQYAESIDKCVGRGGFGELSQVGHFPLLAGLVLGDGSKQKNGGTCAYLNVGDLDQEHEKYIKDYIEKKISKIENKRELWKLNLDFCDLHLEYAPVWERDISDYWMRSSSLDMRGFLKGLFSANGSVVGKGAANRVTLKATSRILVEKVQIMLSSLGASSYITTNKPSVIEHKNGTYTSRQSYDLNIPDVVWFAANIGFTQQYKLDKINGAKIYSGRKSTEIVTKTYLGEMEVFDYTVEAEEHTVWQNGLLLSNCAEILLREYGLCNLSEVVIRSTDKFQDLIEKVKSAVWLGTFQSTLTKFKYIRDDWKRNCEEERLLGVSLTGQLDNPKILTGEKLEILKEYARKVNKQAAKAFDINPSAAITCTKPSGSVSQVVDASSGLHPRRSPFYIRRYRISNTDPLFHMMREQGVVFIPENGQTEDNATTWVVSFPIKAPKNSIFVKDLSAIDQLKWYLKLQKHWSEHNSSCTIYVGEDEWAEVGAFVYGHLDEIIAVSFLPRDNGSYQQAPEEEISEAEYKKMFDEFPKIDYNELAKYEKEDQTTGAQALACTSGVCELA